METQAPSRDRDRLAGFIGEVVADLEPLVLRYNEAVWQTNVTGDARHQQESVRLDAQVRRVYADPERYAVLRDVAARGGIGDARLDRQLALLHNDFRAQQIPTDLIDEMVNIDKGIESRFNNYRATLDGERVSDNQLRDVLRESDDVARRRRAWEASKQVGAEVVDDLLTLVGLRNDAARRIGFDNFYSMSLTLDELDEDWLFARLDELERGTQPLWETYKAGLDERLARRFGTTPEELRPWHYRDPFFQEAPAAGVDLDPWFERESLEEITRRFFAAVGFDVDDLLRRADLYEKPGKSQHAFCMSVDRGADIRVLCNLRPNEYSMATMLHEFGHAVYDQHIDRSLPWVLRTPAHTLTTEASAMLFGRLSRNPAWLATYARMPADEARRAGEALARATREQLLVLTRWCLVMAHMERAVYRDPGQDLNTLWWDLVERFQWVKRPDGRHAPDWASKIHFSQAPVYYHNYLLGEIMASQLQAHLLGSVLGGNGDAPSRFVDSPAVGEYLVTRLYRAGRSMDWRATLVAATGQDLNPGAFVDELGGGNGASRAGR